ncbi:hypothetical protein GCM10017782_29490 [Deinococcus ficus]|nr:hypothetical protein GCM10017782_29490 [Deinococcus ficus]
MADPDDLRGRLVPEAAVRAFGEGEDRLTLRLLTRAQDAHVVGGVAWAALERLRGLVLIHMLREVEGTFALERADAVLDAAGQVRPDLDWLEEPPPGGP